MMQWIPFAQAKKVGGHFDRTLAGNRRRVEEGIVRGVEEKRGEDEPVGKGRALFLDTDSHFILAVKHKGKKVYAKPCKVRFSLSL